MKTFELPNIVTASFSCKSSADATDSQDYTIHVDLSDMTSDDMLEWAMNNGIVVFLQGRIRAGKISDGATIKLHKPGTRTSSIPVDAEEVAKWKPLLLSAGQITADTPDVEIAKIVRAVKKLTASK